MKDFPCLDLGILSSSKLPDEFLLNPHFFYSNKDASLPEEI
jgi:hypothetical protein